MNNKGITLIALVITIIVLIILAGVSINILLGENGIVKRAEEAKDFQANAEASDREMLEDLDLQIQNATGIMDWEGILAKANANPESYKHPETLTSEYIAIGTDGRPVDMDLWNPTKLEDGTWSLGSTSVYGYKKVYLESCEETGGKIKGTVPQYIYNEELGTFKEVVYMIYTFHSHSDLIYAPAIPSSVTDMRFTFQGCTSLAEAPVIPSSVTAMAATFSGCTSLAEAPVIPSSVTNMGSTFLGCTSLTKAPDIPNSVTDMYSTFSGCTNLTEAPVIPSSVTDMRYTFSGCTNLTEAPVIPSSVTSMGRTFYGCTSLTGTITINANPTTYSSCFYNTVQPITLTASKTETPTATAETLNNLAGTANNGNVSVAQ